MSTRRSGASLSGTGAEWDGAALAWEDWASLAARSKLDDAPLAWSCGDLHVENVGSFRGDNGLAYFDLNDFDDAALAPATRDVARFLTSVHLAAEKLELSKDDVSVLCSAFLDAYAGSLADGKARLAHQDERPNRYQSIGDSSGNTYRSVT